MIRKSAKIYYPAGLISIILLPILCIWNLDQRKAFEKVGALDIIYAYHSKIDTSLNNFRKNINNFRKYTLITFSGNNKTDSASIHQAQIQLRSLIKTKNALEGLHFKFDDKAKYWNLVKVNDICQLENVGIFIDGNDIWAYYFPEVKFETPAYFVCGTVSINADQQVDIEKQLIKIAYLQKATKNIDGPAILFLLMCFFTYKRIKLLTD